VVKIMATLSKDAPSRQAKRLANRALKKIRRQYHVVIPKNKGRRGGKR